MKVAELMRTDLKTVRDDATILVGVISQSDIVRAVATSRV